MDITNLENKLIKYYHEPLQENKDDFFKLYRLFQQYPNIRDYYRPIEVAERFYELYSFEPEFIFKFVKVYKYEMQLNYKK
jgi:hypothetical protein